MYAAGEVIPAVGVPVGTMMAGQTTVQSASLTVVPAVPPADFIRADIGTTGTGPPPSQNKTTTDLPCVTFPLSAPPLRRRSQIHRALAKFFHIGWSPPRVPLTQKEFMAMIAGGNPFGIESDGKGFLVYPIERLKEIFDALPCRQVTANEQGILEVTVSGQNNRFLLFPKSPAPSRPEKFALDYATLHAPPESAGKTIIFYNEGTDPRFGSNTKPGVAQWMTAVRELGYEIVYVSSIERLENAVRRLKPAAVLVSAMENLLPYVHSAYFAVKGIDPSVITILGGYAAIPEFARFFDIVVDGEAELTLPVLLRHLLGMLHRGEARKVEAVASAAMIEGGLDTYLAGSEPPKWSQDVMSTGQYYPPVFTDEAAQKIAALEATRILGDGELGIPIGVPIGYDPDGAPRIFIRGESGIIRPSPVSLAEKLQDAKSIWARERGDAPFPLSDREFARASTPEPQTEEEIDRLFARYPSRDYGEIGKRFRKVALRARRGCRGSGRCKFCSIKTRPDGRRPSIDQIIRIMHVAVADGMTMFIFQDDQFVQKDREWLFALINRIKREKLDEKIEMHCQTRADLLPDDVLMALRGIGMGFSIGTETLNAKRAENLGKVQKRGDRYIERAKDTLRRLAATSSPKGPHGRPYDDYYIIAVGVSDTLLDVAEDTLAQLEIIDELWTQYGYIPKFRHGLKQAPYYGDRITVGLSGRENAQPGSIPILGPQFVRIGQIDGFFDAFGLAVVNGALHATGIFHPLSFVWPESINVFFEYFGENIGEPKIGDIYEALGYAHRRADLSESDRKKLGALIEKIGALYMKLWRRNTDLAAEFIMSRKDVAHYRNHSGELPNGVNM